MPKNKNGKYKLVTTKNGIAVTYRYHNFTVATNAILRLGGRLYDGSKLVGEL